MNQRNLSLRRSRGVSTALVATALAASVGVTAYAAQAAAAVQADQSASSQTTSSNSRQSGVVVAQGSSTGVTHAKSKGS